MAELDFITIPSAEIRVSASKMFTYPTRLADSWLPAIQQISTPEFHATRPEIKVVLREGPTWSRRIPSSLIGSAYKKTIGILPPVKMGSEYLLDARYDTDTNIAHILDHAVSLVFAMRKDCPKITVILRARATSMARTAYDLLGIPILCTDRSVGGKLVILPPSPAVGFHGYGWYSEFFDGVSFKEYTPGTPERIFISRKGTRSLVNEHEVEQFLARFGFQKVYFEDIPVSLQWSIGRNAKAVVGIHGAALSSIVFNRNGVKLVELFHPGYIVKMFRYIVNNVGGTWCGVSGEYPPDIIQRLDYEKKGRYFAFEPMRIDIESLAMAIDHIGIR